MKKTTSTQPQRGILFFLLSLLLSSGQSLFSQSTSTEYFMASSISKTTFNPAKRPEKGYIGIPGATNIKLDFHTNTLTLDQFIYPGMGKNGKAAFFMNEAIGYDQFMSGISNNNFMNFGAEWTPLGVGFYLQDLFLSIDVGMRGKIGFNIPKSFFSFLKQGLNNTGDDLSYNFKDASLNATAFAQTGIGISYPIHPSFVLGAKVKLLLGIANAQVKIDNMNLNFAHDLWSIQSQASMLLTYPGQRIRYNDKGVFSGIKTDGPRTNINGSGLGFDLGLTLTPGFMDKFTFSAALIDMGSIVWNNNIRLATNPNDVLIADASKSTHFENFGDVFDELSDSMKDIMAFRQQADKQTLTTRLGAQFNFGFEYAASSKLNLGFLSTTHFDPIETFSEYTLGAAWYPATGFEAGLSYSFVYSRAQTFGLAIHIGSGFFIAADYIFPAIAAADFIILPIPTNVRACNVQFGCVVPIGKKH